MSVLARVPTSSLEPLDSADEGPGRCTQEAHGKAHCAAQNVRESESMKDQATRLVPAFRQSAQWHCL